MWPFDAKAATLVLRIGARTVERWRAVQDGWQMAAQVQLPVDHGSRVELLWEAVASAATQGAMTAVVESVWAPVMLLDTGGLPWTRPQVEAFAKRQLAKLYGTSSELAEPWEIRIQHRPGLRWALVFALPQALQLGLVEQARGTRWQGVMPAMSWGWSVLKKRQCVPPRTGWWVWSEQDRQLMVRLFQGDATGLHPALPICATPDGLRAQRWGESARGGWPDAMDDPMVVGHWGTGRDHDPIGGIEQFGLAVELAHTQSEVE